MSISDQNRSKLRRLVTKRIDGMSTSQETDELSELLRLNPALHEEFVRLMQSEAALEELHSHDLLALNIDKELQSLSAADTPAEIRVLTKEATSRREAASVRRWQLSELTSQIAPQSYWAVAATVLILLSGYLLWPRSYATLVAMENVEWSDGTNHEIGDQLSNDWISFDSGVVRLAYESSAAMNVEGPARLRITGSRDCELQLGSALAYVPPAAHGFTVSTPKMLVIDRGTSFRIEVSEANDTTLQVLEGTVDAQATSSSKKHRLVAGDVAAVSASGPRELILPSEQELLPRTSGRIAFRGKHVPSLGHSGFKGNDRCYVFLERHNFRLPHDLEVNIKGAGKQEQFQSTAGVLQAGTQVDCFLVHSAPRGKRHVVEGTITFQGEVLGIIGSSDKLNATNSLFGSPWLLRCQHPERGFEGAPNRNSDRLEISPDRRTIRLTVRTESIDQIRILVKH